MTEKYRPSNGTEGQIFMEKFCDNCRNDDPGNDIFCEILARAMAFDVDDEEYPSEWIIDTVGPICTSFEQAVE